MPGRHRPRRDRRRRRRALQSRPPRRPQRRPPSERRSCLINTKLACRRRRSCAGSPRSSGVDLAQLSGTGPNGRITENDVRAAAGGELVLKQHKPSEGRREPVRGVRRQIVEHLTRAHREVPAVTFVEECDFTGVDLKQLAAADAEGDRGLARGVPGAERPPRRRRDRLPRALRPRGRRADRPGARRPGRPRLRLRLARGAGRRGERLAEAARAGTLKPEELRGSTFTITSAGQARRRRRDAARQPPRGRHPRNPPDRPAPRRSSTDEIVVRHIGNVSVTFDHRVVDGARAAAFTLDVIARLESGLLSS